MKRRATGAGRLGELFAFAAGKKPAPRDEITAGPLDEHFARLMVRLNGPSDSTLEHAARMASAWRSAGHVCVPLSAMDDGFANMEERLRRTRVVGAPGDWKPLILDNSGRLYLHRYWTYENRLIRAIWQRMEAAEPEIDRELLQRGLDEFFGPPPNDQRASAEKALTRQLCIITGGPGTGKTRTVSIILALLRAQAAARGEKQPRVALTAPTGKAAARLTEAVHQALGNLSGKDPGEAPAYEAVTLHRLLGTTPDSPQARFHEERPLAVDAVVLDEASMVDLSLMAKLFAAVPATARLILLGDKDQLASVEAGSVLGDLCGGSEGPLTESPLTNHIVQLRRNYRFGEDSGIQQLGTLVNTGSADAAVDYLKSGGASDMTAASLPPAEVLGRALRERVIEGFRAAVTAGSPEKALGALSGFRILCAVRRGPYGVENLNRLVEAILAEAGMLKPARSHYAGRPVMILRNDYNLRLFNGDIGILLPDPEQGGNLRAFFLDAEGGVRCILPARLPEHETVWAMTVHKSQGSEFGRVLLILPEQDVPVLTRELLYTGLTRARDAAEIWFREGSFRTAVNRRIERTSGLHDALWQNTSSEMPV